MEQRYLPLAILDTFLAFMEPFMAVPGFFVTAFIAVLGGSAMTPVCVGPVRNCKQRTLHTMRLAAKFLGPLSRTPTDLWASLRAWHQSPRSRSSRSGRGWRPRLRHHHGRPPPQGSPSGSGYRPG